MKYYYRIENSIDDPTLIFVGCYPIEYDFIEPQPLDHILLTTLDEVFIWIKMKEKEG